MKISFDFDGVISGIDNPTDMYAISEEPREGMVELFKDLKAVGHDLNITSSRQKPFVPIVLAWLEHHDLNKYFTHVKMECFQKGIHCANMGYDIHIDDVLAYVDQFKNIECLFIHFGINSKDIPNANALRKVLGL